MLDDADDWEKAVVALIIIAWIVAFFNLLVDFGFLTLALLWSPTEPDAVGDVTNAPFYLVLLSLHTDCEMVLYSHHNCLQDYKPRSSGRYAAKEPYYRGPEPEIVESYIPGGRSNGGYQSNYGHSAYNGYYPQSGYPYSAGSRTLPAIKY